MTCRSEHGPQKPVERMALSGISKPCPSKADPFGMVWGTKQIYRSYYPAKEINATTSLMELELLLPLHDAERRNTALLCDNEITAQLDPGVIDLNCSLMRSDSSL